MKESEIQKQILDYLESKDIFCWRNNVGRKHNLQFGKKGSGDITGLLKNGKRLEIEVKDEKGKQSEEQKNFQQMIKNNKGLYILARCLGDVIKKIK